MSSGKWRPFCLGLNALSKDFYLSGSRKYEPFINTDDWGSAASQWNQVTFVRWCPKVAMGKIYVCNRKNNGFVTVKVESWQFLLRKVEFSNHSDYFPSSSWDDQNLSDAYQFLLKSYSSGSCPIHIAVPLCRYVRWAWLNSYVWKRHTVMCPVTQCWPEMLIYLAKTLMPCQVADNKGFKAINDLA